MAVCRLAQQLDGGPAVFATEVPLSSEAYRAAVLGRRSALPRLEDLAAPHVALIRSKRLSGPCLLAGHSFDGLLAFEVAHQLQRAGTNVELLLVLDSWLIRPLLRYRLRRLTWGRVGWILTSHSQRSLSRAARVTERIIKLAKSRSTLDSAFEQAELPINELPWAVQEKVFDNARDHYQLRPLETRAVLFSAQDDMLGRILPQIWEYSRLFLGRLETVESPGSHRTMVQEPHVQVLAKKITEYLANFFASSGLKTHATKLSSLRESEVNEAYAVGSNKGS